MPTNEQRGIPVLTSMNTVDMVQDQYRLGFIGTYGNRIANMILNESDIVIPVGIRLGLRQFGHMKELFAPLGKIRLFAMDVDGTLTDGKIYMGEHGEVENLHRHNLCMDVKEYEL